LIGNIEENRCLLLFSSLSLLRRLSRLYTIEWLCPCILRVLVVVFVVVVVVVVVIVIVDDDAAWLKRSFTEKYIE
jgi:hypothetical protein